MDAIKKVIRKIRHKHNPPKKIESALEIAIAKQQADRYTAEFWERDKKIVRTQNFEKAVRIRNENLERQREEREREEARQLAISLARMKNLKKAQRKLRKMRKEQ